MKKVYRRTLTFGLLSVLVVGLIFLLTGCSSMLEAPNAKISKDVDDTNPLKYTFDGSNSEPSDAITEYKWTFGDGDSVSGGDNKKSVTHTYDDVGSYTVTLKITLNTGATDSTSITVSPGVVADFEASNVDNSSIKVQFDAGNSSSAAGTISNYGWTFDYPAVSRTMGSPLSKADPATIPPGSGNDTAEVTYDEAGTYTIVLNVEDSEGNFDSVGKTFTIQTDSVTPVT